MISSKAGATRSDFLQNLLRSVGRGRPGLAWSRLAPKVAKKTKITKKRHFLKKVAFSFATQSLHSPKDSVLWLATLSSGRKATTPPRGASFLIPFLSFPFFFFSFLSSFFFFLLFFSPSLFFFLFSPFLSPSLFFFLFPSPFSPPFSFLFPFSPSSFLPEDCWRGLERAGDCWKVLETAGEGWRLLETAGEGWRGLETAGEG